MHGRTDARMHGCTDARLRLLCRTSKYCKLGLTTTNVKCFQDYLLESLVPKVPKIINMMGTPPPHGMGTPATAQTHHTVGRSCAPATHEQVEGATPPGAQRLALSHQLGNQMLHTTAIVLQPKVPDELIVGQRLALPLKLGQHLGAADVCLVAQAILPSKDVGATDTILLPHTRVMPDAKVRPSVVDWKAGPECNHILPFDDKLLVLA
eukprot:5164101-Prymnesium_polylepis.1